MAQKSEFHAVEFIRKVRDEQAARLKGKNRAEIVSFFETFKKKSSSQTPRSTGRAKSTARRSS